jgi:hypothetical protein
MPPTNSSSPQINLTFAALPLTFTGKTAATVTGNDLDPTIDLADIQEDIAFL